MIARIRGAIVEWTDQGVLVDVQGMAYDVLIPAAILQQLRMVTDVGDELVLVTLHYLQGDMSRSVPMLIGFSNVIEREFFARFISVSGVGPKAALKAISLPISTIATAIDRGDLSVLKSLPGIGMQRAKDIIAKLEGKVGKFGLIRDHGDRPVQHVPPSAEGIAEEALAVLTQLQYSKQEARTMIATALERLPDVKITEDLLNEIYRLRVQQPVTSDQ